MTLGPTDHPRADGLPVGETTFLFTDLEGSTVLWEEQPVAMQRALEIHDVRVREAVERLA